MTGRILRLLPIALVLVVAACGSGGGTKTITVTETVTRTVVAPRQVAGRVYLLRDGKVAPVARDLPGTSEQDLLQALQAGPTPEEQRAGLTTNAGNTANSPGDRRWLAQAVYTLSQFDPTGRVTYEGNSYRRADFEDQTPAILVESPLPFQHVTSPLRLTGTANTFEATFQYELKDAAGRVLAKHFAMATSGSGFRGTFDVSIPFTVASAGPGTLTVYEDSAATGKRIHQVDTPLTLEP